MTQSPTYGPHNPHPLSTLRTELVWEGKYDEYGVGAASPTENRREVDIVRSAMPFASAFRLQLQRIGRIDEPRRAAAATGQWSLFEQQNPKQDGFPHPLTPSPKPGEGEQEHSVPLSRSGRGAGGEG